MNEEEAIVYFKNYIKVKKEVIKERQKEGLNADSKYTQQLEEMVEAFEIVIKLLEKKDKQIEQYQNMLATNDMLHVLECENKDKMIDEMAECIDIELSSSRLGIILNKNVKPLESYKKDIKQYFERKVEG